VAASERRQSRPRAQIDVACDLQLHFAGALPGLSVEGTALKSSSVVSAMHSTTGQLRMRAAVHCSQRIKYGSAIFDEPLPAVAYRSLIPLDFVKVDENIKTCAHNIFLNTLLQAGVLGLVLKLAVFGSPGYQSFAGASNALRSTVPDWGCLSAC